MKYTKEQFLKAAELGEVSMIDAKHICSILDEVIGLPQQNDDVREQGNAKKVLSKLKEFRDSLTSEEKLEMFPNDVREDDVENPYTDIEHFFSDDDDLEAERLKLKQERENDVEELATEWLQNKLNNVKPTQFCSIDTIREWVEQAKQMEEQQRGYTEEQMRQEIKSSHRDSPRTDDVEKLCKDWFNYNEKQRFIEGYNLAKETLYTEEQVREAIEMARKGTITEKYGDLEVEYLFDKIEIIQSLKQSK